MLSKAGNARIGFDGPKDTRNIARALAAVPLARTRRRPDDLTPREREVLQLIWAGLTNRALSERLHISSKTGEAHRANMMKKLGVSNMAQLLKRAIEKGLLPHPVQDF
jgi:DNA-binding NarL/FixJ family response regulator